MSTDHHDPAADDPSLDGLDTWVRAAALELGLDPAAVPTPALLALARDVAHGVARPAAPISTFLVGYAAGAAGLDAPGLESLIDRIAQHARAWAPHE